MLKTTAHNVIMKILFECHKKIRQFAKMLTQKLEINFFSVTLFPTFVASYCLSMLQKPWSKTKSKVSRLLSVCFASEAMQ